MGVDLRDGRIVRIPVKARRDDSHGRYNYRFVRGNPRTGTGSYNYSPNDYEVTACVALSLEKVIFCPGVHQTLSYRTKDFRRPGCEAESWADALNRYNRKHKD